MTSADDRTRRRVPLASAVVQTAPRVLGVAKRRIRQIIWMTKCCPLSGHHGRRGVAAAEFSVIALVLGAIMLLTLDLMLVLRARIKIEAAAVQVGQVISQCTSLTNSGDFADFWRLATTSLDGVGEVRSNSDTVVIITGIKAVSVSGKLENQIAWQVKSNPSAASAFSGTAGTTVTLDSGFAVPANQLLLVTEVASPTSLWVRSRLLTGLSVIDATLRSTTYYLARTANPAVLYSSPIASSTRQCMA